MLSAAPGRPPRGYTRSDAASGARLGAHADRACVLGALWEVVTMCALVTEGADLRAAPAAGLSDGWRVRATTDDVRAAWDGWRAARDGGAPVDRVQELRDDLDRLARAVAEQRGDDLRAFAPPQAWTGPVRQPAAAAGPPGRDGPL